MPATTTRFRPLAVPAYQAVLDGDAQVPATANLTEAAPPAGSDSPFARVWQLQYQFDSGWRFVRCVAATDRPAIEGQPDELGVWVYSDGSGNSLRLRVTDSSGQTFQPTGPNLDWTGWKWVTFDLANLDQAGHWGAQTTAAFATGCVWTPSCWWTRRAKRPLARSTLRPQR